MNLYRYATLAEIAAFKKVDAIIGLDDGLFDKACEVISDRVFNLDPKMTHKLYQRVYRFGKKLGVTVQELEDWYFTEEEG